MKKRAEPGNNEALKRGDAILISMEKYPPGRERPGAAVDRGRLETLFSSLHFNVTSYVDKGAEDLKNTLINISETKPEDNSDCFVCFVSAHGNTDERGHYIEAIGDESNSNVYIYDDILKRLMTCDALKGIPKVFFINSCRGEYSKKQIRSKENVVEYMKTGKDSLVVFSTEEGNESLRDSESGTFFVQALCEAILLKHEKEDVTAMATMANKMLIKNSTEILKQSQKKNSAKPKCQVAQIHFNLTGKLFWRTRDVSEGSPGKQMLC